MSSRAFYASGWRLRALSAALGNAAPLRHLLADRALAALRRPERDVAPPIEVPLSSPKENHEMGSPRTADDLALAYRSGRTTPRDVVERALEAASALDSGQLPLRAFIHLDARDVRAQADASTARWRDRRPIGRLDGVPIAVKDEFDVAAQPTTCGTSVGTMAREDAAAVARLRAAGAVLFGKTNMAELGMAPSGLNPHHGAARNPCDPERDSGGSSSGSAVAVAAGIVPIALGTDSGGSLRVPGSLCGVAALKGTFGRVPTSGIAAPFSSVLHAGPLGASVGDVRAAFRVLANEPRFGHERFPSPLRIGVCEPRWREARGDVAHAARCAVERLLESGAIEVAVELPGPDVMMALGLAVLGREAADALDPAVQRALGPSVRVTLDLARGISRSGLEHARRVRARIVDDLRRAFERADVIVTPTTAITAPRYREDALTSGAIDEDRARALTASTLLACLAGVPAAQVPCGHDADGLPVGIQLVTAWGHEALALHVASAIERHVPWVRPRVWFDVLP